VLSDFQTQQKLINAYIREIVVAFSSLWLHVRQQLQQLPVIATKIQCFV